MTSAQAFKVGLLFMNGLFGILAAGADDQTVRLLSAGVVAGCGGALFYVDSILAPTLASGRRRAT